MLFIFAENKKGEETPVFSLNNTIPKQKSNKNGLFLFLDPRGLSAHLAQVKELGPSHTPLAEDLDVGKERRMERKRPFYVHVARGLAERKGRAHAAAALLYHNAGKRLETGLVALQDLQRDRHRVARPEFRGVLREKFFLYVLHDFLKSLHNNLLCFIEKILFIPTLRFQLPTFNF